MKIIFLGVSSALSVGYGNYHSNMLIQADSGKYLLLDCGGDIRHALFDLGYSINDVSAVYISHLHADHVGGLEWLALSNVFTLNRKLPLFISQNQSERLWNNVLKGGLSTFEDQPSSLDKFFILMDTANLEFVWEDINFKLIEVEHTYDNGNLVPSYGLLITLPNKTVFITTDSRFTSARFENIYQNADVIFHDCETSLRHSNQHAHYVDLCTLPADVKGKTWLYDYNAGQLPDAKEDGFLGFVTRGQQFTF